MIMTKKKKSQKMPMGMTMQPGSMPMPEMPMMGVDQGMMKKKTSPKRRKRKKG